MKLMRLITGKPHGFTGFGASARWSGTSAYGLGHVVACAAADGIEVTKATAQRPLGFGGSTG